MIELIILFVVTFLTTFATVPYFIRKFKEIRLVSKDLNKKTEPLIPEMGGISILFGLVMGISLIILFSTEFLTELLGVLSVVLLMGILGILDGIFGYIGFRGKLTRRSKKWKKGMTQLQHIFLPLIASIPLVAIKAGYYTMSVPFIGSVNFGLFYPFLVVPLFITVFGNAFNMLAGLNGLEASSGLVVGIGLLFAGLLTNNSIVISLSLVLVGSLLAFLFYNFYPAKIFPGDITPLLVGALIASTIIVSNMERFGFIVIGLYYIEFFLKLRSKFKAQSFGIPQSDGRLKAPYKKIYSLTHLIMKLTGEKATEKQIVLIILASHLIFVSLALLSIGKLI